MQFTGTKCHVLVSTADTRTYTWLTLWRCNDFHTVHYKLYFLFYYLNPNPNPKQQCPSKSIAMPLKTLATTQEYSSIIQSATLVFTQNTLANHIEMSQQQHSNVLRNTQNNLAMAPLQTLTKPCNILTVYYHPRKNTKHSTQPHNNGRDTNTLEITQTTQQLHSTTLTTPY